MNVSSQLTSTETERKRLGKVQPEIDSALLARDATAVNLTPNHYRKLENAWIPCTCSIGIEARTLLVRGFRI
jgi:hypothetical protein